MPTLPIYEQRTTAQGQLGGQFRPVQMSDAVGDALQGLGDAATKIGGVIRRQQEDEAKSWYAQASSDIDLKVHEDFISAQNNTVPGGKGFTQSYLDRLKTLEADSLKNAPNEQAQELLKRHFAGVRDSYGRQALNYEASERSRYTKENVVTGIDNRAKLTNQMPDAGSVDREAEQSLVTQNAIIDGLNITPEEKAALKKYNRETLLDAANRRKIELNPSDYLKRTKSYGGGFDGVVDVILQEEGGYADNDGGTGAPVNFGINQKANPDVDVKTLTKDGAKQIYKERYWNAIKGDSLPADMQLVAMDAAVNQGVGWTKKALAQAGGDVNKFIELRAQRYQEIAKNPEKAQYLDAWMNRLERVGGRAAGRAGMSTFDMGTVDQQIAWQNYAEQESRRQMAVMQATMGSRLDDEMSMAMNNVTPPQPITRDEMVMAYGEVEGLQKFEALQETKQLGADVYQMQTMTDAQITGLLEENKPQAGTGFAAEEKRHTIMQKAAEQVIKSRRDDPVAFAMRAGIAPNQPLDGQDMPTITAQLKQRAAAARTVANTYGTPMAIFTKAEAQAIGQSLQTKPSDQKLAWLKMIRDAVPDTDAYRAAMQQIRPDSPVTAIAGAFLGYERTMTVGSGMFSSGEQVSPSHVASMLVKGEALLNPPKAEGKEDGTKSSYPMPNDTDLLAEFNSYVGDAFRNTPTSYNEAYQAFRAYYAAQTSTTGKISKDLDSDSAKKAAQSVIGTVIDYNGNGDVIAPWGMDEDVFNDRVDMAWQQYAKQSGLGDREREAFSDYGLMPTDTAGKYYVVSGNMMAIGKDGKPIMLNVLDSEFPKAPIATGQ